ncbi:MAG: phosphoenolpyruvate--protein phosphotransferase [Alphaproteobacteria bacterium]
MTKAAPPSGWSGSRLLLRRLREVMAAQGTAEQRLNRVVTLIAANMVAEVCSVYLLRAGEVLELFATQGLNPEAVHRTRLRVGEGIVGDIAARARPVALADAQSHPNFAYRPETGEEIYQSMMGVPIMRGGRVLGVLAIQNRTRRQYADEEVEAMQTIAMVAAELVASGEFVGADELRPADGNALLPLRLEGVTLHAGPAMGTAVLHQPQIVVKRIVAEDPEAEKIRFDEGISGMHAALDRMIAEQGPGEHREVMETVRLIAADKGWLKRIREAIESGLTAEAAVVRVQQENRARFREIADPYLKERLADFDDLAGRLLAHLAEPNGNGGLAGIGERAEPPRDMVVIAKNMGPAELLDYDRTRLRAVVLEEGSPNAHVAIIARALDIPVVGRVQGILDRVEAGESLIVDGDNAVVYLRPGDDVLDLFRSGMNEAVNRKAGYARLRDLPAITKDGVEIALSLNAGLLIDMQNMHAAGANGIGLYRTEIPFMVRHEFPGVAQQADLYRRILDQAQGKPVVFRTLDVGGDKLLPYLPDFEDENPAMGWRAIRIALDRPAILRQQLRAMLIAAAGRELAIMFPMVSEVAELDAARRILEIELARAKHRGLAAPANLQVGVMLEVPALVWQLPQLLARVDFVSVGSNDLVQFLFASDRGNPRLAHRYDHLAPAVMSLLKHIISSCFEAGVPLAVCGEMAGRPIEALALIGLGCRHLSMAASSIGPVKQMIRSVTMAGLEDFLAAQKFSSAHSLRTSLRAYATDHNIAILS